MLLLHGLPVDTIRSILLPIPFRHLHRPTRTVLFPRRENFYTRFRHKKRVFKLRRPSPILRRARPVIWPCLVPMRAQRNHRLDCKCHSRLRYAYRLVLRVVRHVRRCVEEIVNAVAAVGLYDRTILRFGMFFDNVAWFAEGHAGFY